MFSYLSISVSPFHWRFIHLMFLGTSSEQPRLRNTAAPSTGHGVIHSRPSCLSKIIIHIATGKKMHENIRCTKPSTKTGTKSSASSICSIAILSISGRTPAALPMIQAPTIMKNSPKRMYLTLDFFFILSSSLTFCSICCQSFLLSSSRCFIAL